MNNLCFELWVEYYYLTESFDREVSSKKHGGVAVPTSYFQQRLMDVNSNNIHKVLQSLFTELGIPKSTQVSSKSYVCKLTHDRISAIYELLPNKLLTETLEEVRKNETTRTRTRRVAKV